MKANHISFQYYERSKNIVLSDINFEIPQNKISLLMGGSGSGKSTLAYILAGLFPDNGGLFTNGFVSIHAENLKDLKPHQKAKYVTMMFQNADLQFCMSTLYEELIFCLENINLNNNEIDRRIANAILYVGTTHLLHQKFSSLSGGEKQKCALTCIIALQAKYIILDEPFANIDPESAHHLICLISKLQKELGLSILIIDHMIDRLLPILDHTFILKDNHTIINADITPDNIHNFESLFIENGLLFPRTMDFKSPTQTTASPIITFHDVSLSIASKEILNKANFNIYPGTINAILGPSGCGKTTLLKSLFGRTKYQGRISMDHIPVQKKHYKELCAICGIVLQNPGNQFVTQNVLDEILFSLKTHSSKASELDRSEAIELLKTFGLDIYQRYSPYMLSQGQQRRLAVLSVLCTNQKILLLDEPTYGQDGISTHSIMSLLKKKVREEGLTVLMTTHDTNLAHEYADQIFTMSNHIIQPY